jgi:hypothetical protein
MPVSSRSGHRPTGPAVASLGTGFGDPFAVNPIRRSFAVVAVTSTILLSGLVLGDDATMVVMVSVGWVAISALLLTFPILVWSLAEEGIRRLRRRVSPPVEELGLSARVEHVLRRHGYESIRQVDETDDEALLMLSNMDRRAVREIRRAVSLWRYRRWQAAGFPADGPG